MSRVLGFPILDSGSSSKTFGIATLSSGSVTVNTTSISSSSVILLSSMGGGTLTNLGFPIARQSDITDDTSFIIKSVNLATGLLNVVDNNMVAWMILEPTDNP